MTSPDVGRPLDTPIPMLQRLARVVPYFKDSRWALVIAAIGSIVAALTEPLVPALMQPLLDQGFQKGALPLWMIPVVIVLLFAVRGAAGFVAQYGSPGRRNRCIAGLRGAMFARLLDAAPACSRRTRRAR